MKFRSSIFCTTVCAALLAGALGCQPEADEADVDTSVGTTETVDSNMTDGAETPGSNTTTVTELP